MSHIAYFPSKHLIAIPYTGVKRVKVEDTVFTKFNNTAMLGSATRAVFDKFQEMELPVILPQQEQMPGRFAPMTHQKETIAAILQYKRLLVRDDMGTGKTAAAIWAADILWRMKFVERILVIGPLSCVHSVWENELYNLLADSVPHELLLAGTGRKRVDRIRYGIPKGWLLTNHDATRTCGRDLLKFWKPDLIIVDEADAYKNPNSRRSVELQELIRYSDARVWAMTGTPTPECPSEAVGIHKLLHPESRWTVRRFRKEAMVQIGTKWAARPHAVELADSLMRPTIRHRSEDCIDLPELTYKSMEIELTQEQEKAYHEMKMQQKAKLKGQTITAANAGVAVSKLLQISQGFIYSKDLTNDDRCVIILKNKREQELLDFLKRAPHPVLVFSIFVETCEHLNKLLNDNGLESRVIYGEVSKSSRNKTLEDFKAGKVKAIVAHPKTMAHGLNLIEADTVLWYGPPMSNGQYEQANKRVHRNGQIKHCHVIDFHGSPTEQRLFLVLRKRGNVQKAILELAENL